MHYTREAAVNYVIGDIMATMFNSLANSIPGEIGIRNPQEKQDQLPVALSEFFQQINLVAACQCRFKSKIYPRGMGRDGVGPR